MALTRGASAAGEQLLLLTQQLRERDEEIAAMIEARESMDRQLEQLRKQLEDKDKAANRPVKKASDDGSLAELGRVKAELAEMAEEKLQLEKQVARLRAILQSLGYDPDNLSDEDLENPRVSAQATKEIESTKQLLASAKELNRDLRKQVDDLERRISRADLQLERQEASAAKAAGQLQAQVQRLTAQLADAQAENEALRKGTAESAAEVADLKTSLADLRKASMLVRKELAENQGAIGTLGRHVMKCSVVKGTISMCYACRRISFPNLPHYDVICSVGSDFA
ncbi:unnamed protein product [Prorocentrum cordatum]|uniref:Uncharacterized protein n=1 Tax=Prorocentrum cordatum TaxID=2364126 RepID=A0ABN9PQ49_9DINO|nr:unnamed protein product [Polarella glacialis]